MRHATTAARFILGLLFVITGLNGFLNFIPPPKDPMPQEAMTLVTAMMQTFLMRFVAGTQLVGGLLLVVNRYVPLGLALLAPIVVNILAFHVFLAPKGLGMAVAVVVLEGFLAWSYRGAFRSMLAARTEPS